MSAVESLCVLLDGSSVPPRSVIGGKAASLAQMRSLGLNCPPAFVLPTSVCRHFHAANEQMPDGVSDALRHGIGHLEDTLGRQFGGPDRPLLVSVRSGAPISMPGMMDSVLNLGLNDDVEAALAAEAGSVEYAADTHRRFVASYATIVLKAFLEDELLSASELRREVADQVGRAVPSNPWDQLHEAVAAVLGSWNSGRARTYRRHMGVSDDLGTAVTVQAMVFGNMGVDSGTGVLFTRNPLTGDTQPYGEYLAGAQGDDVVSGDFTPRPVEEELATRHPDIYAELLTAGRTLELAAADVQDIEFTIERGTLYLLQTRVAKRSPEAAVRLAVDFVDEGLISPAEALARVTPDQARQLLRPRLDPMDREAAAIVASGEPASPGVGVGIALSDADAVVRRSAEGESVVFVAHTTSPEDVRAMIAASAVCTETGGSTSHAAVVCRGLGLPAVVGGGAGLVERLEGHEVTVDGGVGVVFAGSLPLHEVHVDADERLRRLTEWARHEAGIEVVEPDDHDNDGDVRDLDELGIIEPDQVAFAVAGADTVRGTVVETDSGVSAAVAAGVRRIVARSPLPILLGAVAHHRSLAESAAGFADHGTG